MTNPQLENWRDQVVLDVAADEGFRQFVYRCPAGKQTIGFGFNLDDVGLSRGESIMILQSRLSACEAQLVRVIPNWRELTDKRKSVLMNMCYNLGVPRLLTFKRMLAAIEKDDHAGVAREMLNSLWSEQVGDRAKRLADDWVRG